MPRFARELAIAFCMSLGLALFDPAPTRQAAFVIFLSVFAFTRIATEFWTLFILEQQDDRAVP